MTCTDGCWLMRVRTVDGRASADGVGEVTPPGVLADGTTR